MATLRTEIYTILSDDAQLTASGKLGNTSLLGRSAAAPYGVIFTNAPKGFDLQTNPVLTYYFSAMAGRRPQDIYLQLTAWGAKFERVEAVVNRSRDLLDEVNLDATDYEVLDIGWDFAGPESFDEFLRAYFWMNRYLIKAWPK